MTARERGFLLLTSRLGIPDRKVLTVAQMRKLAIRVREARMPEEDRELTEGDLVRLGYGRGQAGQILALLEQNAELEYYVNQGRKLGCGVLTRVSPGYPPLLRQRLGFDSPGCLWFLGDLALLNTPAIALVGSRELGEANREFARAVGQHAAREGLTLISGNARGADKAAQEACLEAGGRVISVVADELCRHRQKQNVLYLSEDGFDEAFSAQRALQRNRCIHALGQMVFVAQAQAHKGGTWDGTVKNLRYGWSGVACFRDGSEAARELEQLGAYLIDSMELTNFAFPEDLQMTIF